MVERRTFVVEASQQGERLDRFLAVCFPSDSRTQLQRAIQTGHVTRNGTACQEPNTRLRVGDVVVFSKPPIVEARAQAERISLEILYDDDDLVVVNKPAHLVVHPSAGHETGTLVNALLAHDDRWFGIGGRRVPGIVHRLDKGTSGVMVVARSDRAHRALSAMFAVHDLTRRYLAIVIGQPPSICRMETLHGPDPRDPRRFSSRVKQGRRAVTQIVVKEQYFETALVEATLETGRTHQVRVHCADGGFPLLGDTLYLPSAPKPLAEEHLLLERPALHAAVLIFQHPVTGREIRCEAALPHDLQQCLERLRTAHIPKLQ